MNWVRFAELNSKLQCLYKTSSSYLIIFLSQQYSKVHRDGIQRKCHKKGRSFHLRGRESVWEVGLGFGEGFWELTPSPIPLLRPECKAAQGGLQGCSLCFVAISVSLSLSLVGFRPPPPSSPNAVCLTLFTRNIPYPFHPYFVLILLQ